MVSLMQRRRAMILQASTPTPPTPVIPSGYVTDGLIFFLDGKQLVSASSWTDIVGGKTFELTNCSLGTNGVVFNGAAYGIFNGRVSSDWENETIEVYINGKDNLKTKGIFSQPYMDGSVGISMRFGGNSIRVATGYDAVSHNWKQLGSQPAVANRIGCAANTLLVANEKTKTDNSNETYSKNTTGTTVLGASRFSGDVSASSMYIGTIYCVRIYSRKLTEAEIKANQANDLLYYA